MYVRVRTIRLDFSCTSAAVLTLITHKGQRSDCIILESRRLLAETTIYICFSDQVMDERSFMHHCSYMVGCFRRTQTDAHERNRVNVR